MTRRGSIRLRLTAWYAGSLIVGGALLLGAAYAIVHHNVRSSPASVRAAIAGELRRAPAPARSSDERPAAASAARPGAETAVPAPATPTGRARSTTTAPAAQIADAQAAVNATALDRSLAGFGVAFAVLVLASLAGGWVIAGRALTPLRDVTAAARSISAGSLGERVRLSGPADELRELADTFDAMLDRLAAAFDGQRRFIANASHELRTPLAVIASEIDVALADNDPPPAELRALAGRVRAIVDRLGNLVARLLVFAEADRHVAAAERVDLAQIVREAIAGVRARPDAAGVAVKSELAPVQVVGDEALLTSLVENLVENAITHNVAGGFVAVATSSELGCVLLRITNSGPAIDRGQSLRIFEPFVRDPARAGAGLGLTIARTVADAHGGAVSAEPRPDGGLDVVVELPSGRPHDSASAGPAAKYVGNVEPTP